MTTRHMSILALIALLASIVQLDLPAFGQSTDPGVRQVAYDNSDLCASVNPGIFKAYADAATGSGFLIRSDGLIATNHHVAANARYVAVQSADGRTVVADVVVLDPRFDLAILKVDSSFVAGLTPLPLMPTDSECERRRRLMH